MTIGLISFQMWLKMARGKDIIWSWIPKTFYFLFSSTLLFFFFITFSSFSLNETTSGYGDLRPLGYLLSQVATWHLLRPPQVQLLGPALVLSHFCWRHLLVKPWLSSSRTSHLNVFFTSGSTTSPPTRRWTELMRSGTGIYGRSAAHRDQHGADRRHLLN